MIRRLVVRVLAGLAAAAVAIQFVPYGHHHANPRVAASAEAPWPDAESRAIAVSSCYDCHSNRTKWRWYSNVAPISWWVQHDVEEGRDSLNFTEWGARHRRGLAGPVAEGEMPPAKYTLIHGEAKLTKAERDKLVAALRQLEQAG